VANTLAALAAGARQAEVTLSGIGERAGNASLEQVVMGLVTRPNFYNLTTGIVTEEIFPRAAGFRASSVSPFRPMRRSSARNAFAHESGHPPARRHEGPPHLRDHDRRAIIGRKGSRGSCSASTPAAYALDAKVIELGYKLSRR